MESQPAKVKSIRQVKTGQTQPAAPGTTPTPALTMEQAVERWESQQEEVKDLKWSEVPDAMLHDFLRASVGLIKQVYGSQAPSKSAEIVAILLASRGVDRTQFVGSWPNTIARLQVDFELRDFDERAPAAPEVEFSMEVPQHADEAQIRQSLADWADQPSAAPRLLLDPSVQLPPSALRALLRQVEQALGDQESADSHQDALMATSSLLVLWEQMEQRNAATADFVLSGLTMGDEEVAAGREAVIHVACQKLDLGNTQDRAPSAGTKSASVRYRPH